MKKTFLSLAILFSICYSVTTEELGWLYDWWHQSLVLLEEGKIGGDFSYGDRLPMPVMEAYPRAAAQLDGIVADSMKWGRSLEWALNYLKPRSGPAAALPDSVRREILYYIYRDRLIAMNRPWGFYSVDGCCMCDYFIHGGAGSSEVGWIRFVDILLSEDPCFYGFFTVAWALRGDVGLGPSHATRMIQNAMEEGKLLSYSVNPVWHYDMSLKPCTLYNLPAYKAEIPVEYDFWLYRIKEDLSDTLRIFILQKGGYEYLISMSRFFEINLGTIVPSCEDWLERFTALSE